MGAAPVLISHRKLIHVERGSVSLPSLSQHVSYTLQPQERSPAAPAGLRPTGSAPIRLYLASRAKKTNVTREERDVISRRERSERVFM
ncbi:hypothetical protein EVAR_44922_1 [Eumeta japonica]|uniref:Uncharacterized protein n=1 Tax=Eumeta variegata TaxID=151549 RepID=A0A4C1XL40_EUMVA|nr:hypothetical protein EVAR_44922_1 [Eumeta japonica]